MINKEQLINIGVEKLAEIILSLYEDKPDIRKHLDRTFAALESDPKYIISIIKDEITFLEGGKCIDDYEQIHDSFLSDKIFADQLNQVRIHIMEYLLPRFPNEAVELLLNFLDTQQSIFEADGENGLYDCSSCGFVGDVFVNACADLGKAYKSATHSLDDAVNLVYDRFVNDEYDIYKNIISHFKDVLGDDGFNLLRQKLEKSVNQNNIKKVKLGLQYIADFKNDVDAYIKACSISEKLSDGDHREIAERLIKHCRGREAIQWLDFNDLTTDSWCFEEHGNQDLKIQALALCGDFKEAQAERLKRFDNTLSSEVYNEILQNAEQDFINSFKRDSIQKALAFQDPYVALTFLKDIQEFEQAAKFVRLKIGVLNASRYYDDLRPVADILCDVDPLAATLLYHKLIDNIFAHPKSCKYYYDIAAEDLAKCKSLSGKITDWQGHQSHQLYFKELSVQQKRKRGFWPEYEKALKKRMTADTKIIITKID